MEREEEEGRYQRQKLGLDYEELIAEVSYRKAFQRLTGWLEAKGVSVGLSQSPSP